MTEYSPNDLADVRSHLLQLVSRPLPPFPGPEPDMEQRRTYVETFLSQCFPRENTEDARKLLRRDATIIAAKLLIKGRITISTVARFAWEVDKVFWDLWFLGLLQQSKPAWPWPRPPVPKYAETLSTVFAKLKQDHDRDGGLDMNRMSIPEEGEYPEARSPNESPSIQVLECNGMHYPLPVPNPTVHGRRKHLGGITFVWGLDGRDFNKIRERLMEERIEVTWRYEGVVHGSEVVVECPIDTGKLPEAAHALVVGPVNPRGVDGSELHYNYEPINLEGISRLWADIRTWYSDCTMDRLTTLRSYLENMAEAQKARGMQTIPPLPEEFKEVQAQNKEERKACGDAITAILDNNYSNYDLMDACFALRDWVISRKEGICLDVPERINLAADLWRERAETPEKWLKVSGWIFNMKKRFQHDLLRDSMRLGK